MQERVENPHDEGEDPGDEAEPVISRECQRGKAKPHDDAGDQKAEPDAECERGEGKKREARADGANAGIIGGEKIVASLVGDVESDGESESDPGEAEGVVRDGGLHGERGNAIEGKGRASIGSCRKSGSRLGWSKYEGSR